MYVGSPGSSRIRKKTITDTFEKLKKDGYVYKGKKPVYWCFTDETALAEAFAHLVANAAEATFGRPKARITLTAKPVRDGSRTSGVVVTVYDNGRGIAAELKDKIFSPFCTTKPRGMGLGLPIVKRTVFDHNGRVDIDSFSDTKRFSPTLESILKKVRIKRNPDIPKDPPDNWAVARVGLSDGRVLSETCRHYRGSIANPMNRDERLAKHLRMSRALSPRKKSRRGRSYRREPPF